MASLSDQKSADKKAYLKAYLKAYREANREKIAAQEKAYREANPEKVTAYDAKKYIKSTLNIPPQEIPVDLIETVVLIRKIKRTLKQQRRPGCTTAAPPSPTHQPAAKPLRVPAGNRPATT